MKNLRSQPVHCRRPLVLAHAWHAKRRWRNVDVAQGAPADFPGATQLAESFYTAAESIRGLLWPQPRFIAIIIAINHELISRTHKTMQRTLTEAELRSYLWSAVQEALRTTLAGEVPHDIAVWDNSPPQYRTIVLAAVPATCNCGCRAALHIKLTDDYSRVWTPCGKVETRLGDLRSRTSWQNVTVHEMKITRQILAALRDLRVPIGG